MNLITSQTLIWNFDFCSAAQAAIKEQNEAAEDAGSAEIEIDVNAKVEAAKAALKEATEKVQALAALISVSLKFY